MTFFLLLLSVLSQPHDSPFACDSAALTPQARTRHFDELSQALRARNTGIHELSDGFEFKFPADAATFELLTEWTEGERRCCPFFDIDLRLEREHGPLKLRLTGREGVKPFIQSEFDRWFKNHPLTGRRGRPSAQL